MCISWLICKLNTSQLTQQLIQLKTFLKNNLGGLSSTSCWLITGRLLVQSLAPPIWLLRCPWARRLILTAPDELAVALHDPAVGVWMCVRPIVIGYGNVCMKPCQSLCECVYEQLEVAWIKANAKCKSVKTIRKGSTETLAWRLWLHRESGLNPLANVYFLVGGRLSEVLNNWISFKPIINVW